MRNFWSYITEHLVPKDEHLKMLMRNRFAIAYAIIGWNSVIYMFFVIAKDKEPRINEAEYFVEKYKQQNKDIYHKKIGFNVEANEDKSNRNAEQEMELKKDLDTKNLIMAT